jgi:DNA primase
MIDRSTIDRILDTAQIVDVIQDFIPLRKFGTNYKGLCPFHNEKTPSFSVSPAKGIFKCFGCGKAGNALNFVMEHENLSYVEGLKFLARKYHIEIEFKAESSEEAEQRNRQESMMIVSGYAGEFFHSTLLEHESGKAIGLSYLKERGIRDDMVTKFQLGYSPEQKDAFSKQALKKGYKKEFLVDTGLSIDTEQGLIDRFRGRVIFPIHNLSGRIIAFGGRTLLSDKKIAKYLNSPESDIYSKSRILYGIFQAKREIIRHEKCYLVEGYTDVVSMHQVGVENVVASSGTSLTVEQIRLMKRFTENVTVLYDGDAAGIKASLRGIDLILQEGMNVRVVLFPDGEDPDSYARSHSSSEMLEFLKTSEQDFILFKTTLLQKEASKDPIQKGNLIRDIIQSISLIPDRIKRSVFIKECATKLEISEEIVYSEINKILRKRSSEGGSTEAYQVVDRVEKTRKTAHIQQDEADLTQHYEKEFIRLLLKYGNRSILLKNEDEVDSEVQIANYMVDSIEQEESLKLQTPHLAELYEAIANQLLENGKIDSTVLIRHHNPLVSSLVADLLAQEYILSELWKRKESYVETEKDKLHELVPETVMALKLIRIRVILNDLKKKLDQPLNDDELYQSMQLWKNLTEMNKILSEKLGGRTVL